MNSVERREEKKESSAMESEASHRSSVSAPAPPSVHSRVLQQLDISEKSHDRYLSNTYAAIEETRSLCRFINTEGEGNTQTHTHTHTHTHWRAHPSLCLSLFLSPLAYSVELSINISSSSATVSRTFLFPCLLCIIFSIIGEYIDLCIAFSWLQVLPEAFRCQSGSGSIFSCLEDLRFPWKFSYFKSTCEVPKCFRNYLRSEKNETFLEPCHCLLLSRKSFTRFMILCFFMQHLSLFVQLRLSVSILCNRRKSEEPWRALEADAYGEERYISQWKK